MNHHLREKREREHIARRWAIAANASVVVLFCGIVAYTTISQALRSCGRELFGWSDEYRWCTFTETWTWLHSEASAGYWIFLTAMTVLMILGLLDAFFDHDRK